MPQFGFLNRAWMQVSSQLRGNKTIDPCTHDCSVNYLQVVYPLNVPQHEWLQSPVRHYAHEFHHHVRCHTSTDLISCVTESDGRKKSKNYLDNYTVGWSVVWCVLLSIQVNHYTQGTQLESVSRQIFATLTDCWAGAHITGIKGNPQALRPTSSFSGRQPHKYSESTVRQGNVQLV